MTSPSADQSRPRGPKFRRRAAARPDEVLDAALALFIERGFAATRVEDIGKAAGISKGAVYLYFPSKEAIIEALVRRAISPIAGDAVEMLKNFEGDPRIIITMALRMLARRLADPQIIAIPRLLIREVISFPQLAELYRREVLDRALPAVIALLRRGMAEGYLRPLDPELSLRSLVGPIVLHLLLADVFGILPEGGLGMDRLMENHLAVLFDGLSLPQSERKNG